MAKKIYTNILITSGISLFAPPNIFGKATREQKLFDFERSNPIAKTEDHASEIDAWYEKMRVEFAQTQQNPKNISAEYSMLYALQKMEMLDKKPNVVLFHTDTFGGNACAKLLASVIENDFNAHVKLEKIADLDVNDRNKLNKTLGNFMQKIGEYLRTQDTFHTCFAPIGGYKVMTSFGYIAGAFYNFSTAYLHEDNQHLHEIPPVPIRVNEEFIYREKALLCKLHKEDVIKWEDLTKEEKKSIEGNAFLFERVDNFVVLNAFGNFICREYFTTQIRYSTKVKKVFSHDATLRTFMEKQVEELVKKIKQEPGSEDLNHHLEFKNIDKGKLKFKLYKGNSDQGRICRIAYNYNKDEDVLEVNYVWSDHDKYDLDMQQGIGLLKREYFAEED